jgi:hypothetical protein
MNAVPNVDDLTVFHLFENQMIGALLT